MLQHCATLIFVGEMLSRSFRSLVLSRSSGFWRSSISDKSLHFSITMHIRLAGTSYLCSIDLDTCAAYAFLILSARPLKPARLRASLGCASDGLLIPSEPG